MDSLSKSMEKMILNSDISRMIGINAIRARKDIKLNKYISYKMILYLIYWIIRVKVLSYKKKPRKSVKM